jgi:hypothetical protein
MESISSGFWFSETSTSKVIGLRRKNFFIQGMLSVVSKILSLVGDSNGELVCRAIGDRDVEVK